MEMRRSRRTILGGMAGSALVAILAACGGNAATETPRSAATGQPTVGGGQQATTIGPTRAAATAAPGGTTAPVGSAPSGATTAAGSVPVTNPAGKVTLYTSAVQSDADGLKAAFAKKYPNIELTIYRDGTEKVIAKLRAEQEARSVIADVLLIADAPTMESLKADTFLQPYRSPFAAALPKAFVEAEGYYTGTKIINTGIAVNTGASLPRPAVWKDLLKPEYKGKLVSPSPQYSGAAALNYTVFLNSTEYGADFLRGLQKNGMTIVQSNGDALNKIISGELPVGIVTDNGVRAAKAKGSPVEMIYPTDGAIPITEPIALVARSKNAAAAKAFMDFVLSAEGQALVAAQNYIPLLASVPPPAGVPTGIKEFSIDAPAVAKQLADGKKQFADIFGS